MNNIFGTAGIRAKAGQYPLDSETLFQLGRVLAKFFIHKYGNDTNILIACDTRASAYLIKSLIKAGLLTSHIRLYDAQVLPTPAVLYLVHELKAYDGGVIITASHNPYTDNGVKIVDRTNGALSTLEELMISNALLTQNNDLIDFSMSGKEFHVRSTIDTYSQKILAQFDAQTFKDCAIVIDCANGATATIAPAIFSKLGIKVIAINTNPNGININAHCGSTYPEVLQKTILKYNAKLGFAFDGDGDRIVVVTANGSIKDGDDIIAFLATNPKYKTQTGVVGTVVSNVGLELWLNQHNKKLIRSAVGEKNLLIAMQANNYLIGGESSGHIILSDFAKHSDGIFTALKILETAVNNDNWQLETFVRMPQVTSNLAIKFKKDLTLPPLAEAINKYQNLIKPGRLIVRYSGTEDLLRILLEGEDVDQLKYVVKIIELELSLLLNEGG